MTVKQYSDLVAWQRAMDLVEEVYSITKAFPREELYGLTNQVRRAAVSIPSNIAEGQSRASRDFIRFLSMAHGSLSELETQMEIAMRLGYTRQADLVGFVELTKEVGRLIHDCHHRLKNMWPRNSLSLATGHWPLATRI